jgi:hypothetical protein
MEWINNIIFYGMIIVLLVMYITGGMEFWSMVNNLPH